MLVAKKNGKRFHRTSDETKAYSDGRMEDSNEKMDGAGKMNVQQVLGQVQQQNLQDVEEGFQEPSDTVPQPGSEEEDGETEKEEGKGKRKLEEIRY